MKTMDRRRAALVATSLVLALWLVYAGWFMVPQGASFGPLDRRAIQHLIGFWGLSIVVQGFVASFHSREDFAAHAAILTGVALASWLEWLCPHILPASDELRALARVIRNPGTIYLACGLLMAAGFRTRNPRWTAVLGLLLCVAIPLYWEIVHQPLIEVYGAPPRHVIQLDQVIADLVGVALANATRWGIAPQSSADAAPQS